MNRFARCKLQALLTMLIVAMPGFAAQDNRCTLDAIQQEMQPLLQEKSADFTAEADFWEKPDALYIKGQGKEEDIVLAKFKRLIECGYSSAQLEIAYVLDTRSNTERVLLAYYPANQAEPVLLDALSNTAKSARYYPYYHPISMLSKNRIERLLGQDNNVAYARGD